jgi:hypothetical protein
MASEKIGIPQGNSSILKTLKSEPLPDIILQNQVREESIVGTAYSQLVGKGSPRFADEQIVNREQGARAQANRPQQQERQDKKEEGNQRILPGYAPAQCKDS